jgi:hypothetical protein
LRRAIFLLLLGIFGFAPPTQGTSLSPLRVERLVQLSEEIVHGTVAAAESRWTPDRSSIVTETRIQVFETLKGEGGAEIVLTQLGGTVGAPRVEVPGIGAILPGQEALFFVSRDERGVRSLTGLSQGRFDVRSDLATGAKVILAPSVDASMAESTIDRSAPTIATVQPLEDFLGSIRDLVEKTED